MLFLLFVCLDQQTLLMLTNYYSTALLICGTLMLFMGFYLIVGNVPKKDIYNQFRRSRRIIWISFVLLSFQFFVQMIFDFRSQLPVLASSLNLSVYYIVAILSAASSISLINKNYLSKSRVHRFLFRSVVYNL